MRNGPGFATAPAIGPPCLGMDAGDNDLLPVCEQLNFLPAATVWRR
jgi:hypothetical protein